MNNITENILRQNEGI